MSTVTESLAIPTDLVVVIDTSGSMEDEAAVISEAAKTAIEDAKKKCSGDVHEAWFGIEGTWIGTNFKQSYANYLVKELGVDRGRLEVATQEDGAAAVIDLAEHFNWRPDARKAIFYLGDEALAFGDPHDTTDEAMRDRAIAKAREKGVVVFTYRGTPWHDSAEGVAATTDDYRKLAEDTNGTAFVGPASDLVGGFEKVLETVICRTIRLETRSWGCNELTQLVVTHDYVSRVDLVDNAYIQGRITIDNKGKTDCKDISVTLSLKNDMHVWGIHFTSDDSERLVLDFNPLGPGQRDSRDYTMKLFQKEKTAQRPFSYKIQVIPKYTCEFRKDNSWREYVVKVQEPAVNSNP